MKKLSVFICSVLLACMATAAVAEYTITDLVFGPSAINNSGQVVGSTKRIAGDGLLHGYLWDNGVLTELGSFDGDTWARDINDFGIVAGASNTVVGPLHGFRWENDNLTDLGILPGGRASVAYGINNEGYIAGDSRDSSDVENAVLWNPDLQITSLVANNSTAYAINNNNQVVGVSNFHSFLWENNVLTDLETLPGGDYSEADDINDNGQIVGRSHVGSSANDHAFLWDNGVMIDLETYEGTTGSSRANAINEHGQIVGWAGDDLNNAVIWFDGKMTKLDDLIDPGSGWQLEEAYDINDRGQIVGSGRINGVDHGFLLTPIPENQPPTADAGPDQTAGCTGLEGTLVTLDGSGSSDPDSTQGTNDDIVSFKWYEAEILIGDSEVLDYLFEVGPHPITLEVTDSYGETDHGQTNIIIQDTTPPSISVSVSPNILWPPNHKMVHVTTTVTATDNCDAEPIIELVSVIMNESDETITYDQNYDYSLSDGKTSGDIQIVDDFNFYLRSERSGKSDGRTYTITYRAIDASGNESTANAEALVPHNI